MLIEEGLTRELVHHVQSMRKDQDLAYEARITVYLEGPAELVEVIERHKDVVARECLATKLEYTAPPSGDAAVAKVEGHVVKLAIALEA